jgi:hypothetical protein
MQTPLLPLYILENKSLNLLSLMKCVGVQISLDNN